MIASGTLVALARASAVAVSGLPLGALGAAAAARGVSSCAAAVAHPSTAPSSPSSSPRRSYVAEAVEASSSDEENGSDLYFSPFSSAPPYVSAAVATSEDPRTHPARDWDDESDSDHIGSIGTGPAASSGAAMSMAKLSPIDVSAVAFATFGDLPAGAYVPPSPRCPASLFNSILDRVPKFDLAVDAGIGCAHFRQDLADSFRRVISIGGATPTATSAPSGLPAPASPRGNVIRASGRAEDLEKVVAPGSVDFISSVHAFHSMDRRRFLRAARRALSPDGTLALVGSLRPRIVDPADLDPQLEWFYSRALGGCWDAGRDVADKCYEGALPGPTDFAEVERLGTVGATVEWRVNDFLTYLSELPAYRSLRARDPKGVDPLQIFSQYCDIRLGPGATLGITIPFYAVIARKPVPMEHEEL